MKQLIIGQSKAYASSAKYTDLTTVPEGAIAIFNHSTGAVITTSDDLEGSVEVVCGRGADKMPIVFPEVYVPTLTVTKASYEAGTKFKGEITVPATEKGVDYTVIVVKTGTVFNERANWTFTSRAKSTIAADVAKDICNQIVANSENLGVKATVSGGKITIEGKKVGEDFAIIGADGLTDVAPVVATEAKPAKLDKAYIQDLASRCAAGKGFNDTYRDGDSIYPGYPEPVEADQYVLYSLRFAVPRVAAKQRDEVVYQILHIAVPVGSACIATLDGILGISAASPANVLSE